MSAFVDCIKRQLEDGDVTQAQLDEIEERLFRIAQNGYSEADAAAMIASVDAKLLSESRRRAALSAAAIHRLEEARVAYPEGEWHAGSVKQVLSPDHADRSVIDNVHNRGEVVFRNFMGGLTDDLELFETNFFGLTRDKKFEDAFGRAMFGEKVADTRAAEVGANGIKQRRDLFERWRRAGGQSAFNPHNKAPQHHDSRLVGNYKKRNQLVKAGKTVEEANQILMEEWRDFIKPHLDRKLQISRGTGLPMTDAELDDMIAGVFDTIRTGGLNKAGDSATLARGPGRFVDAQRVFHFKDYDSWKAYHDRYGGVGFIEAFMREGQRRSRDIGLLEILGPDPETSLGIMINRQQKALIDAGKGSQGSMLEQIKGIQHTRESILNVFNEVNGRHSLPVNQGLAEAAGSAQSIVVSALLGGAVVSSQPDIARLPFARTFIGMDEGNIMSDAFRVYNPLSREDKIMAARQGLIYEIALGEAILDGRYAVGGAGTKTIRKLPEMIIRGTGLQTFTSKVRFIGANDFLNHISRQIELKKKWGEIPTELRQWLGTRGFNGNDWKSLSAISLDQVLADKGQRFGFLNLRKVAEKNSRVADLIHSAQLEYMELVSPTGDPRVQAALTLGTQSGTPEGVLARMAKTLGTYPALSMQQHANRVALSPILGEGAIFRRVRVAAVHIAEVTAISALALQFREISKGRDPRSMKDHKFWYRAMLQGGGLSIYGDFLDSIVGENRYGDSFGATLTGPVIAQVDDIINVGREAVNLIRSDRESNFADALLTLPDRFLPGRNVWYARLFLDRLIFDQLRLMFDPNAAEKQRRMQRRLKRSTGQDYFSKPGEFGFRLPDFGGALESPPRR